MKLFYEPSFADLAGVLGPIGGRAAKTCDASLFGGFSDPPVFSYCVAAVKSAVSVTGKKVPLIFDLETSGYSATSALTDLQLAAVMNNYLTVARAARYVNRALRIGFYYSPPANKVPYTLSNDDPAVVRVERSQMRLTKFVDVLCPECYPSFSNIIPQQAFFIDKVKQTYNYLRSTRCSRGAPIRRWSKKLIMPYIRMDYPTGEGLIPFSDWQYTLASIAPYCGAFKYWGSITTYGGYAPYVAELARYIT